MLSQWRQQHSWSSPWNPSSSMLPLFGHCFTASSSFYPSSSMNVSFTKFWLCLRFVFLEHYPVPTWTHSSATSSRSPFSEHFGFGPLRFCLLIRWWLMMEHNSGTFGVNTAMLNGSVHPLLTQSMVWLHWGSYRLLLLYFSDELVSELQGRRGFQVKCLSSCRACYRVLCSDWSIRFLHWSWW